MQRRQGSTDSKSDLSFPPPFAQQAKYLALADEFLGPKTASKNKSNLKVINSSKKVINSSKHFRQTKKKAA
jgi:hypothetical protein